MAIVTFDTLSFVKTLRKSGMSEEQAEAIATAVKDAQETQLVTRLDLQHEMEPVRTELKILKWMLALVVLIELVPFLKSLFS